MTTTVSGCISRGFAAFSTICDLIFRLDAQLLADPLDGGEGVTLNDPDVVDGSLRINQPLEGKVISGVI